MYKFKVYHMLIYVYILYYNMITFIALANTFIMSGNYFIFLEGTIKFQSLSSFKVYNTVLLAVITMLCVRSQRLIFLLVGSWYPEIKFAQSPHPLAPEATILLCFDGFGYFQIPCISVIIQYFSLTYFTYRNALKVHPCYHKWQDSLLSYGKIIFHKIHIPHLFIHSFVEVHLRCFDIVSIVNHAVMNMEVHESP